LIITYPLCGQLIHHFGWESAFYAIGAITFTWWLFFQYLVFDTPEKHPRIELEEKERILRELGDSVDSAHSMVIPWKEVNMNLTFSYVLYLYKGVYLNI